MGKALGKRTTNDDFDVSKPCYVLLGWIEDDGMAGGFWERVCVELLTHAEVVKVQEQGMDPYSKFQPVSRMEFNVLGIPKDFAMSDYFDLAKQREVSARNNNGPRQKPDDPLLDRLTDPKGE